MLVSKEEYIKNNTTETMDNLIYSEPKYLCPKCKSGGMCKNLISIMSIDTDPPSYQYTYRCNKCHYIEILSV